MTVYLSDQPCILFDIWKYIQILFNNECNLSCSIIKPGSLYYRHWSILNQQNMIANIVHVYHFKECEKFMCSHTY